MPYGECLNGIHTVDLAHSSLGIPRATILANYQHILLKTVFPGLKLIGSNLDYKKERIVKAKIFHVIVNGEYSHEIGI